jgi:hypothetical protein
MDRSRCGVEGCGKPPVADLYPKGDGEPEPRCYDCLMMDLDDLY